MDAENNIVLIGSGALKIRAGSLLKRDPLDFDFVCSEESMNEWLSRHPNHSIVIHPDDKKADPKKPEGQWTKWAYLVDDSKHVEFEIASEGSTAEELLEFVAADEQTIPTSFGLIPSLDVLFTIKSSHKYLKNSPHFWKNAKDWHLMKAMGAEIPDGLKSWLTRRKKETYWYKHPRLKKMSGQDFFDPDQGVEYVYDHDSIHRAVAIFDKPAYRYYMKDGEEVDCDKDKFFSLPEKFRIAGVAEEACVLAIERSLVPYPGKKTPREAWAFALMKVCTSITSGWFRKWGYDNLPKVMADYPEGYWEKFEAGLKSGIVLPFRGKAY